MASRYLTPLPATRGWLPEPLFQLQREIDRVFDDVFTGGGGSGRASGAAMTAPRIDLQEADGELRLHADLPGVAPADLDVRVDGDVLTIRGERKSESDRNEHNFHVMERSHGRFQRSIQLPFAPDPEQVQASVREGVLEIRIPKQARQERSKRIEVRGASSSSAGGSVAQAVGGGAAGQASEHAGTSGAGRQGSGTQGSTSSGGAQGGTSGVGTQGGTSSGGGPGGAAGATGGATAMPAGQGAAPSSTKR